jgi:hypothetical protein
MLLGAVVLLVSAASADTLSVGLRDVAYIAGPLRGETRGRLLFNVTLPDTVRQARIDFAKLTFPAALIRDTSFAFTLEAYVVATAWQGATVRWDFPWRSPGGDFDSARISRFATASADSHPIVLNVSRAVEQWQSGRGNFGLLLKRPDYEGGGFGIEGLPLRELLGLARVKFYFVRPTP